MNKRILHIICFLLAVTTAFPQQSANRESKRPLGMYVFVDQLGEIYPDARIKKVNNTIARSLSSKNEVEHNSLYLVTVGKFLPVLADLQALKDYARDGNTVFIACNELGQEARDFFSIRDSSDVYAGADSLKLEKDGQWVMGYFSSKLYNGYESYFAEINGTHIVVLGRNSNGKANFIRINYGTGSIYILLQPFIFTNYFLLEKENYKYTQAVLSYVPKSIEHILWKLPRYSRGGGAGAQNYDGNDKSEFSFMSVIWGNPNLRWAFLLGLLVLFLLLLFGSKRKQRIIPVIPPVQNTTFEFAQTMGDLYFNLRNNNAMAEKKIRYWQEYVRNHYNLSTRDMGQEFWEHLAKKSGQPASQVRELELAIVRTRNQSRLSDRDLVHLSNCIDRFYKG